MMRISFQTIHPLVRQSEKEEFSRLTKFVFVGEFVGLMFDESVIPDIRHFFEDVLSKLSVFMAQNGTPTVRAFICMCLFESIY